MILLEGKACLGKRLLQFFWLLLICTIWCQNLLTAILALGWIYRWVRHQVSQKLFKSSPMMDKTTWQQFTNDHESLTLISDLPHLFRKQPGIASPKNKVFKCIHQWLDACWLNFRVGLSGILTTWSLTLFPCGLWAISW